MDQPESKKKHLSSGHKKGLIVAVLLVVGVPVLIGVLAYFGPSDGEMGSESELNSLRRSYISSCKKLVNSRTSVYSETELQGYCTCEEKALYNKYGSKFYEKEMIDRVKASGYSQEDTDLVANNCIEYVE